MSLTGSLIHVTINHMQKNRSHKRWPTPYTELGCFLFKKIKAIDNNDLTSLKEYIEIVATLTPLLDKHLPFGYMRELNMWIGLKRDAPEDFKDYDKGIKEVYPEVFTGKKYKPAVSYLKDPIY